MKPAPDGPISDGTMACPVLSPGGLPCVKRIPEGWTAEAGHGGGHMWMSEETREFLDTGHYDAEALLRGESATPHSEEECYMHPSCPRFWEDPEKLKRNLREMR